MFDMVINHVGYGHYSSFHPFNSAEDFHDCEGEALHLSGRLVTALLPIFDGRHCRFASWLNTKFRQGDALHACVHAVMGSACSLC
jgi:hypothetical protein